MRRNECNVWIVYVISKNRTPLLLLIFAIRHNNRMWFQVIIVFISESQVMIFRKYCLRRIGSPSNTMLPLSKCFSPNSQKETTLKPRSLYSIHHINHPDTWADWQISTSDRSAAIESIKMIMSFLLEQSN